MKTGYFAKHAGLPGAISISRSSPKFFSGPEYKALAPTYAMLKLPRDAYNQRYKQILLKLPPRKVFDELTILAKGEEPILLCWERSNTWCHRRFVAEWLELTLGVEIPEIGLERSQCIAYKHLPEAK